MAYNDGMKDLIQLINLLQDAATTAGMNLGQLDLPQIAVIGEQSTGKSSVLENFVGRDFLPRGSGVVTRTPIILQLHNTEEEEDYAEFLHLPDRKFTNFNEVRKEIQDETDRLTEGKGISNKPINLRIYSPNVLNLTLVDLPGMTQVALGNQPPDIAIQITDLVREYISSDNTLILAVSPANQDLANSCALKLAKSVDPEGLRTIGVLTKLDLMDSGTDAREILENKVLPLRRGYIGLVNRSQEDIDKNKDIHMAQQSEMNFFRSKDAYRHMADRMGTKYLQQILNEQLCEHIRDKMPVVRANLKRQYKDATKDLESMQAFADEKSDTWKQTTIIRLMQEFSETFRIFIEGHSPKANGTQMNAGARLNHCIYSQIFKLLDQMVAPSEKDVKILIQNEHGKRNALFVSELVIDVVVGQLLQHYSEPMNKSVEIASEIISTTIADLSKQFTSYPRMMHAVQTLLAEKLKSNEEETKKHLQMHLKAQASFINTKHPEFQRIVEKSDLPADFNPTTCFCGTVLKRSDSNSSLSSTTSSATRDGIERSPRSGRRNTAKIDILHTGWMTLFPKGITSASKKFWCRLTSDAFMWYQNDNIRNPFTKKDKDPLDLILLSDLQLIVNGKMGHYTMELPGGPASQQLKPMTIAFATQNDEDDWYEAFMKAGLEKATAPKPTTEDWVSVTTETPPAPAPKRTTATPKKEPNIADISARRHLYEKVDKDSEIQDSYEKIIYMIHSYMKIVDRTIHDLVPKYIYLLLVDETTEYTSKNLLANLLEDENWREFLEVSPREQERRERLYNLHTSVKEAMDLLSAVEIQTG